MVKIEQYTIHNHYITGMVHIPYLCSLASSDFRVVYIPHILYSSPQLDVLHGQRKAEVSSVFIVFIALLISHSIAYILIGSIICLLLYTDRERLSIACILT